MRIGLIIETLTHLILALTTNPIVAMATFFFSEHTPSFGGPPRSRSVNAVPMSPGTRGSVNLVGVFGGLRDRVGDRGRASPGLGSDGTVLFAFAGSAVFVVLIWRQLAHISHD